MIKKYSTRRQFLNYGKLSLLLLLNSCSNSSKKIRISLQRSFYPQSFKDTLPASWQQENINFSHLRGTVLTFLKTFFGDIPVRFRASYFPFTEPSAEVDVQWKGKWLEVMGCGMVDPKVLEKQGIDSEKWTGFAAGLGVERFCMVRHQIDDIRKFYTNDLRFLEQF